ncbi:MAG: ATP-binding protein [bacterium]
MAKPLQLIIPTHFRYLNFVRESFYSYGNYFDLPKEYINDVVLVVDEALSNIIEHSFKNKPDSTIKITCRFRGRKIRIEIEDNGNQYLFAPLSTGGIEKNVSRRSRRGFGQYLIQKLMNNVKLVKVRDKGNKLILEKSL